MLRYQFADVPAATTPAVLAEVAAAVPDRTFVVADDGTVTYGAMAALVADLAAGFAARALEPGRRLGILLPNGVRWVAAYLAAHAAGLTVVPLNTWYRSGELAGVARRADLGLIVTQDETFGVPSGRYADEIGASLRWEPGDARPPDLPTAAADDPLVALRSAPVRSDSDALLLFTSGSSAEPKAVRLSQEGVVRTAHAVGERQGVREDDRIWFGSPMFFVYGCSNAIPNTLTHAATLCTQERFEPAAALEFIEQQRCTVFYGVAPITRALASHPDLAKRNISSLRAGTGNATAEDLRLTMEVLGVEQVCNAYGLTEGHGHSTITSWTDPPHVRIATHGTVLPTQELRIVVDGAPVGPDVEGEIQIRGLITPGYLDSDAGSDTNGNGSEDRAVGGLTDGGWFRTGDIGRLDSAGRLTFIGRSHEMMKVNGINVSPVEVETLLVEHTRVDEAFVFGLATADGDQSVGCVLVSTVPPVEHDALAADVQSFVRNRAAAYKVPTTVRIVTADQLPLTATGKVSKRALKEQAEASL